MDNREYTRFFKIVIYTVLILCLIVMVINIIADPFFHYHKPITRYRLYNERYINDGIARQFEYDAIITGNSLSQNFKVTQYDDLFGTHAIKLPFAGANTAELWSSLGRAVGKEKPGYNERVKEILVCFDCEDIVNEDYMEGYAQAPEYLYDDNLFNDLEYLLNKETLYKGTIYNVLMTLKGSENTDFDEYSAWEKPTGPKMACAPLDLIDPEKVDSPIVFGEEDMNYAKASLEYNVLPVIRANRDIHFKILLPPASIAKWAEYYDDGEVAYRIDGMDYILSTLLNEENVSIFGFADDTELITDLDRYCDTIHYDAGISEWMLNEISSGRHEITKDSLNDYISRLHDFYENYDYTMLNQYIE